MLCYFYVDLQETSQHVYLVMEVSVDATHQESILLHYSA